MRSRRLCVTVVLVGGVPGWPPPPALQKTQSASIVAHTVPLSAAEDDPTAFGTAALRGLGAAPVTAAAAALTRFKCAHTSTTPDATPSVIHGGIHPLSTIHSISTRLVRGADGRGNGDGTAGAGHGACRIRDTSRTALSSGSRMVTMSSVGDTAVMTAYPGREVVYAVNESTTLGPLPG